MRLVRSRLTFANVVASLALFLAIGVGTSYAISVSGSDVVNGSLTGADLKNNSVKAKDIAGLGANVTVRPGPNANGTIVASSNATCNKGETLISGGYGSGGNVVPSIVNDSPQANGGAPTSWQAIAVAPSGSPSGTQISVTAFAVCAS